jgi:hypothetical protein
VNVNGKSRTIAILVGVIQAFVLLAITYGVGRVEGIERKATTHEAWSNNKVVEYEGRIRATEERNSEILRRLERIENKLDRLDSPKVR